MLHLLFESDDAERELKALRSAIEAYRIKMNNELDPLRQQLNEFRNELSAVIAKARKHPTPKNKEAEKQYTNEYEKRRAQFSQLMDEHSATYAKLLKQHEKLWKETYGGISKGPDGKYTTLKNKLKGLDTLNATPDNKDELFKKYNSEFEEFERHMRKQQELLHTLYPHDGDVKFRNLYSDFVHEADKDKVFEPARFAKRAQEFSPELVDQHIEYLRVALAKLFSVLVNPNEKDKRKMIATEYVNRYNELVEFKKAKTVKDKHRTPVIDRERDRIGHSLGVADTAYDERQLPKYIDAALEKFHEMEDSETTDLGAVLPFNTDYYIIIKHDESIKKWDMKIHRVSKGEPRIFILMPHEEYVNIIDKNDKASEGRLMKYLHSAIKYAGENPIV